MAKIAKTQKAKGVMDAIPGMYYGEYFFHNYHSIRELSKRARHSLIIKENQIVTNGKLPCFARPCPKRPRHGFVDSRVIKNNTELMKLWNEARKIDPEAELILGPYVPDVKYNAVYVNSGSVVVGKGNDGATGGRNSISIPVAPHKFPASFIADAGLNKKDAVYLEAIYSGSMGWLLAQARGGPAIDAVAADFVPKRTKVKKVVRPINDLVKWEKQAADLEPGTVVYGKGHSLASHAAIHCVLNKIPFVTSHEPKVGEILAPKGNKTHKISREGFKRGVRAAINLMRADHHVDYMLKYFYYSLSVLHNWAYINKSEHADWMLGSAAMIFVTLSSALCHGEFRHKYRDTIKARSTIYKNRIKNSLKSLKDLREVLIDFYSTDWRSGYGGLPWATCSWYTHNLWQEIVKTFDKTTASLSPKEIKNIMGLINKATNVAHNNGWWFNKFAKDEDLDAIAKEPGIAAFMVSDIIYNIRKKAKAVKGISKRIGAIDKVAAPCGYTSSGELVWIKVSEVYAGTVSLQIVRENGSTNYANIELNGKKYNDLKKKFYDEAIFCKVKRGNNFSLPTLAKTFSIKKKFGVA